MTQPRYVSFYTPDYRECALHLQESLLAFRLEHLVLPVDDAGTWQRNTHFKPMFLWKELSESAKQPVVWVDADAIVRKRPVLLERLNADLGLVRWYRGAGRTELLSGTIFLNPGPRSMRVLDRWIQLCMENVELWDQACLDMALAQVPEARVEWLPVEYCFIFDTHREAFPEKEPVIEQFQWSRRMRGKHEARALRS